MRKLLVALRSFFFIGSYVAITNLERPYPWGWVVNVIIALQNVRTYLETICVWQHRTIRVSTTLSNRADYVMMQCFALGIAHLVICCLVYALSLSWFLVVPLLEAYCGLVLDAVYCEHACQINSVSQAHAALDTQTRLFEGMNNMLLDMARKKRTEHLASTQRVFDTIKDEVLLDGEENTKEACGICFSRKRKIAFIAQPPGMCGHTSCIECFKGLLNNERCICHECRAQIERITPFYQ